MSEHGGSPLNSPSTSTSPTSTPVHSEIDTQPEAGPSKPHRAKTAAEKWYNPNGPPPGSNFGARLLDESKDVWSHNAWDHVELPEDFHEKAEETLERHRSQPVNPAIRDTYNENPERYWDEFYSKNKESFFKDRAWLRLEFPELIACTEADAGKKVILEVGCGAGNTVFPLLIHNENSQLEIWATDYSSQAVEVVKSNPLYPKADHGKGVMKAAVWDITSCPPLPLSEVDYQLPDRLEPGAVDVLTVIFVLSALHPSEWDQAIHNLYSALKPGGLLLIRDYGRHDLAQLRIKKDRLLDPNIPNLYIRGDGTRVYFFTKDELQQMLTRRSRRFGRMEHEGGAQENKGGGGMFEIDQLGEDRRLLINRKEKLKMYRIWMQVKARKNEETQKLVSVTGSLSTDQTKNGKPSDVGKDMDISSTNVQSTSADIDAAKVHLANPTTSGTNGNTVEEGDEDEEDERMNLDTIQGFANKIQHVPGQKRSHIVIPKRGEKDFEPLAETVNLQEMMLQRSREALFSALQGVSGSSSRNMSHAVLLPNSNYPRVLIQKGHLLDTTGITVRTNIKQEKGKGKAVNKSYSELLPEEALFMLERGSLQIWMASPHSPAGPDGEAGYEWNEEIWGVENAVEMSVMEGFGTFIGKDGLTWERYQAYAYLKRLGYTVQRTRRFIPKYFLADNNVLNMKGVNSLPPFRTWWLSIPTWISTLFKSCFTFISNQFRFSKVWSGPLIDTWRGPTYASLFQHLRIIPSGHSNPLPTSLSSSLPTSASPSISPLKTKQEINPYIPFYHIWKPARTWSKAKWDRGSPSGLIAQPPDFYLSAIEARNTALPTIQQIHEIFQDLPDEERGPRRRVGPQYQRNQPSKAVNNTQGGVSREVGGDGQKQASEQVKKPYINPIAELRNGDRGFIVAVNDSGNIGWVRFGRSGFTDFAMM